MTTLELLLLILDSSEGSLTLLKSRSNSIIKTFTFTASHHISQFCFKLMFRCIFYTFARQRHSVISGLCHNVPNFQFASRCSWPQTVKIKLLGGWCAGCWSSVYPSLQLTAGVISMSRLIAGRHWWCSTVSIKLLTKRMLNHAYMTFITLNNTRVPLRARNWSLVGWCVITSDAVKLVRRLACARTCTRTHTHTLTQAESPWKGTDANKNIHMPHLNNLLTIRCRVGLLWCSCSDLMRILYWCIRRKKTKMCTKMHTEISIYWK